MSLKNDLKLDITELDRHTLDQPLLFNEWSEKWAKALFERDKLKEQISSTKALADSDIRANPENYGWDKEKAPTEPWFAYQVAEHPDVKKATAQLLEAQYEVNMMSVAKESLEHRMSSLKIMTELYKGNYFSATSRGTVSTERTIENHNEKQQKDLDNHPRMKVRRKSTNE